MYIFNHFPGVAACYFQRRRMVIFMKTLTGKDHHPGCGAFCLHRQCEAEDPGQGGHSSHRPAPELSGQASDGRLHYTLADYKIPRKSKYKPNVFWIRVEIEEYFNYWNHSSAGTSSWLCCKLGFSFILAINDNRMQSMQHANKSTTKQCSLTKALG